MKGIYTGSAVVLPQTQLNDGKRGNSTGNRGDTTALLRTTIHAVIRLSSRLSDCFRGNTTGIVKIRRKKCGNLKLTSNIVTAVVTHETITWKLSKPSLQYDDKRSNTTVIAVVGR